MALILCLETATTNCSVALARDGKQIALRELNSKQYSHAEKLHVFIDEILKEQQLEPTALDALAISKGPGSYTGLRIGVSAAKGLCFSLDIPLIAIPTLDLISHRIKVTEGFIVPLMDARRMEVYSAVFNPEFEQVRDTKAEILEENSFEEYLSQGPVHFIGNGVQKFQEICNHPNANFHTQEFPSATEMCGIAEEMHKKSDTVDVAYFEPYYLKDFIAG